MADAPTHDPYVGRIVADKYRLDAVIGSGGTGTVYRALHMVLDRPIALKVLNPALVANPTAKARFRREARAASRLDHPYSVQVFDYGIEPDGLTYLAMELLDGRELYKVIYDDWPLGTERIVRIVSQILAVLAAAHEIGIVHRDLKPENIMLVTRAGEDGRPTEIVKVADFGIAKTFSGPMTEESINLTRDGAIHGTPEYMAPEQARGDDVDGRTDLYAVGVILYEMMSGTLPFAGESTFDVILKQMSEKPVPPSQRRADCDVRLEPIAMRALEKDKANRWPDALTMRDALLEAVADGAPLPLTQNLERRGEPEVPVPLTRKHPVTEPLSFAQGDEGRPTLTPEAFAAETRRASSPERAPPADGEAPPVVPQHSPVRSIVVAALMVLLAGGVGVASWQMLGRPVLTAGDTRSSAPEHMDEAQASNLVDAAIAPGTASQDDPRVIVPAADAGARSLPAHVADAGPHVTPTHAADAGVRPTTPHAPAVIHAAPRQPPVRPRPRPPLRRASPPPPARRAQPTSTRRR